jgi:hypothetical protein
MRSSGLSNNLVTKLTSRHVVVAFFILALLIRLALFQDYGVSWDEPTDLFNGIVNVNYIGQKLDIPALVKGWEDYPSIPELDKYLERDHGPAFEYPVALLTKFLGLQHDMQKTYYLRHLLVALVSFGGLVAFYKLAKLRFTNWRFALLAAVWLFATPRLFAEGFYNAKDAVFMALFVISMNTLAQLLHKPSWKRGLWHGLACGAAIGLRVNGVMLLPLTIAGLVLTGLDARRKQQQNHQLALGALVWLPTMIGAAILLWPWLWESPWKRVNIAFENLSHFRWESDVLYQGEQVLSTELPWHYALVWIGITTPLAYLMAFGFSLPLLLARLLKSFPQVWRTENNRLDLLFAAWLAGPLLAVIVVHSVLYDGWRHLYFIYPAMILLAVGGLEQLWYWSRTTQTKWLRGLAVTILVLFVLGTGEPIWRIVRDHPNQQVYFNGLLSPREIENGFERDYWALSLRQGLEWILKNDSASKIKVGGELDELLEHHLQIMSADARNRLVVVPREEATYFLTFYRGHYWPYTEYGWEVHEEYCNGVKILSVHKQ